ncbi:MAG: LamG domain-containing protein [Victivallales bacterium]|jgi:hypothetical protein|nr:LamG domain-containing protein [Victivallales bacterium]
MCRRCICCLVLICLAGRGQGEARFRFDREPGGAARFRAYAPEPLVVPDAPELNPTGSFTISAWVAGRWVDNSHNIVAKSCNGSYRLRVLRGGRLWLLLNDGEGHEMVTTEKLTVPERKWTHVAAVVDFEKGSVAFVLDGTQVETLKTTKRRLVKAPGPLVIGAYDAAGKESFNGWLDELSIEHRAVPIAALRQRVTATQPAPSAYEREVFTPPIHVGPHEPDDVFHIVISARAGFRSAQEFARIKTWLAPRGDGPYVRLGLTMSLPYMAWTRSDTQYVFDPNAPLTKQRLAAVKQWTDMAVRERIPLKIGCAGGAWFDPAREEMDATDWLELRRRNCMWYADHRVQTDTLPTVDPMPYRQVEKQLNGASFGDVYVTFSRYNGEAQALRRKNRQPVLRVIADFYRQHPELLVAVNVDGELELALHHGDQPADYNPYAILEFRDWARGLGEYHPRTGRFRGEAYVGWQRYHDETTGLAALNRDFGTAFATWELKFFSRDEFAGHAPVFDLDVDHPGGFDPPRRATEADYAFPVWGQPAQTFWQLWNTFRALLVRNEYATCAADAVAAGLPKELIYTQTIPGSTAYAPAKRIWLSAVPPWGGVIPNGRLGLNLFNDTRPWLDSYLEKLGDPAWGSPEWRYHYACAPVADVADTLRADWAHGCRFVAPLVWPDHLQDTATGEGIRQFIERYRTVPRSQAHLHRRTPAKPAGKAADGGRIYGF